MAAAKTLDYRPNELARSMTTGRSGIIGVVVGDIENPFFSLAVRGISDAARAAGFNVILANSGEGVEAEKAAVRPFDRQTRRRADRHAGPLRQISIISTMSAAPACRSSCSTGRSRNSMSTP